MNKLQQEELNVLVEFDRICRKHDIIYSLSSGTLLGSIRHHGFIPWDDDIDVNMSRSEFNRFEKLYWRNWIKISSINPLILKKITIMPSAKFEVIRLSLLKNQLSTLI